MVISPLSAIGPANVGSIGAGAGTTGARGAASTASSSGTGFGDAIGGALDELNDAHQKVDDLAMQAATGDLTAVHDFTIASTEAQLMTQLTVEVRNRAVEAFNDIMRMQV